jgi:UrcA family protein
MIRSFAFVAGALLLAGPLSARAEDGSMTVRVSDLNLNAPAGAHAALRRARTAAQGFCGDADIRDLQRANLIFACQERMTGRAVAAMRAPMVSALYEGTAPATAVAGR